MPNWKCSKDIKINKLSFDDFIAYCFLTWLPSLWNDHWLFFFFLTRYYHKVNNYLVRLSDNQKNASTYKLFLNKRNFGFSTGFFFSDIIAKNCNNSLFRDHFTNQKISEELTLNDFEEKWSAIWSLVPHDKAHWKIFKSITLLQHLDHHKMHLYTSWKKLNH